MLFFFFLVLSFQHIITVHVLFAFGGQQIADYDLGRNGQGRRRWALLSSGAFGFGLDFISE